MSPLIAWHLALDVQLRFALAWLDGWQRAPVVPQIEPELRALRRRVPA